jgi:hypothetical protein
VSVLEIREARAGAAPFTLRGLPAKLHLMNDNVHPYQQAFDLGGQASELVDVVTAHLANGSMYIQHAIEGVNILLSSSNAPYRFTIRVTGKSRAPQSSRVEIGLEEHAEDPPGVPRRRLFIRACQ